MYSGIQIAEEDAENLMYCIELPMWIGTSLVIDDQIHNEEDNFTNLYSMDFSTQLKMQLNLIYQIFMKV